MSSPIEVLPDDEHNRRLIENVHPPQWENPKPVGRYNLVVIGGGTAGLVTAAGAAGLGAKVALVERNLLGGDCLNVGCVPSKALLAAAKQVKPRSDTRAEEFTRAMERLRRLRADISPHDSARRFQDLGVDVYLGQGRFVTSSVIDVEGATLQFKKACIATGARAGGLSVPGLDNAGYLTNETLFNLEQLPKSLAIIGGGPIGCEMAQAFSAFGCRVTLIEKGDRVLGRDDPDAADIVQESLVEYGVEILTQTQIESVASEPEGRTLDLVRGETQRRLVVDQILVAAGRIPNTEGLGLDAVGIAHDARHGIQVNDRLQTTVRNIFAAGDICTPMKFTHHADFLARTVIQNSLFFGRVKASSLVVPWCTYTFPELAHVGLQPHEARQKGYEVTTLTQEFDSVDRAILDGDVRGFVRVHLKGKSDRILGATIVGPHAGELINELTLAMRQRIGLAKIGSTIHPYPTRADAIRKLGDAYNRTRLKPWVKGLLGSWFKWSR